MRITQSTLSAYKSASFVRCSQLRRYKWGGGGVRKGKYKPEKHPIEPKAERNVNIKSSKRQMR